MASNLSHPGFCIENKTENDPETGTRRSWFRLVNSSSAKKPPGSPKSRSHTGSKLAQLTGLPLFDTNIVAVIEGVQ